MGSQVYLPDQQGSQNSFTLSTTSVGAAGAVVAMPVTVATLGEHRESGIAMVLQSLVSRHEISRQQRQRGLNKTFQATWLQQKPRGPEGLCTKCR